jgi:hypothetical protein
LFGFFEDGENSLDVYSIFEAVFVERESDVKGKESESEEVVC